MTAEQAFGEMVQALMRSMKGYVADARLSVGKVKEVNLAEGSCDVERDGSPDLYDVRLNAVIDEGITDKFTVVPAVGSLVMVMSLGEATEAMVVATSKIEKVVIQIGEISVDVSAGGVVMNGGKLGGLIDITKLTEQVNRLVDAFNGHTHTIPSGGINTQGSAAAQSTVTPVTVPAVEQKAAKLDKADYENEKVKH